MADLKANVRFIKGIGEQRANALSKLGVVTLRDLVTYFPRGYEDRTVIRPISSAGLDETVCVRAMVASPPRTSHVRRGMDLVKLRAVDETGALDITYFNQNYVKDQLIPGETYVFYGKVGGLPSRKTLTNPVFERVSSQGAFTGCIVPVYRLTAGISQRTLMNSVRQGLDACSGELPDALPASVALRNTLAQPNFAYENIHFPSDFGALEFSRRRLVFEELFVLACALSLLGRRRTGMDGIRMSPVSIDSFYSSLPFLPTSAQRRSVDQAISDMLSGRPMNRLVQGDVGSGKTLVAAALIWFAWKNGFQSAFMAPTEILADQHLATLSDFLGHFGIKVGKLTGSMAAKQKREFKELLAAGKIDLVIGTHALLGDDVTFKKLALTITDEQHRFGVEQRSSFTQKGKKLHVLVMSATPIPRTLALIIYGDLDVSVIDEMPPGRQPVDTFFVREEMRPRINSFIRRLVGDGRQVFIVCPMIEENEELLPGIKSAQEYAKKLSDNVFPELRVACVHGKMKSRNMDSVMAAFIAGEYDILVSTTVIEVGVDVPNAALMIVENADRFGLSQLHQLRGRVGRGKHKSYCVLFSDADSLEAQARLKIMCDTNDGFKISEEDLRIRGPGDFFGSRQHGLPDMHIADLISDMNVLQKAQEEAHKVLREDPDLSNQENLALKERIRELFEIRGEMFN